MTSIPIIAGVGMTAFGRFPDKTLSALACEAVQAALADAHIEIDALDAVFSANSAAGLLTGQESVRGQVALKPIGIGGIPVFNVENACASGSSAVHLAAHYIAAGAARCVLVVGSEKMVTGDRAAPFRAIEACSDIGELAALKASLGPDAEKRSIFMDFYAQKVEKYFASSSASKRHLAAIAAKNHSNGALNPHAQNQSPQTADSVLASRVVVDPLTVLMCSPVSDGAAALVLVSPDWARAHQLEGPSIAATAFATDSFSTSGSQMAAVASKAYAVAGIEPRDVAVAEVHDATAAGELFEYENLGLAQPYQGWKLVDSGEVFLGGRCPVNPSGGLIARGHPLGATGVAQVCELTWQLRGQAGKRQVPAAKVGVAQCAGGQSSFGRTTGAAAMSMIVVRA